MSSKLALITGYSPLPPYFSLGFHYSKWEPINTKKLMDIVKQFNKHKMPVDVIWLDIEYARGKRYFEFDQSRFSDIDKFVKLMEKEDKRITVITDPHIKSDNEYFVYNEGMHVVVGQDYHGSDLRGVFIKDKNLWTFYGTCWPEESVWVDFLNEKASEYWRGLYKPDKFIGTTKLFNFWIDMNEPSVFSGFELTLPKDVIHTDKFNDFYYHKDLHNAYGILMARSTYQG